MEEIKNRGIYDIGQTVNGVSTFIYIDGLWYYYIDEQIGDLYQYPQQDITDLILYDEFFETTFIGILE